MVLAQPRGGEWQQRQPEQQMKIGPKHPARHVSHRVQHVMVIVPVDTDVHKAQHIAEEHRQHRTQRLQVLTMRHLQLEDHDGDDDREHAVAERFEPPLPHTVFSGAHRNFHLAIAATAAGTQKISSAIGSSSRSE